MASFFRFLPKDNELRQDGADFRPSFESFQMVPTNGTRPGSLTAVAGVVRIASADESIVKIAPGPGLPAAKILTFQATQLANFTLLGGAKAGNTVIIAEDQNGNRVDHLRVSVKDNIAIKYNVVRLKDAIDNSSLSVIECETKIRSVEILYINQTNVSVQKVKSGELFIQRNLSDSNGILQLDELIDNKETIISDQIDKQGFSGVDVVFVYTWNIEGAQGFGFNVSPRTGKKLLGRCERSAGSSLPTIIYLNSNNRGGNGHELTAVHELGHHFGMSHTGIFTRRPTNFVMDEVGGSFKMTQDDINLANRTGI